MLIKKGGWTNKVAGAKRLLLSILFSPLMMSYLAILFYPLVEKSQVLRVSRSQWCHDDYFVNIFLLPQGRTLQLCKIGFTFV